MSAHPGIDLARLVGDAATLAERASPAWTPESDEGAAERLARWEKGLGGPAALDKRLAWARGEDPAEARRRVLPLLGRGRWVGPWPAWTDTLLAILAEADRTPPTADAAPGPDPVPFEELYAPMVEVFERRLAGAVPDLGSLLAEAAHRDLRRAVLGPLARIALRTLEARLQPEPPAGPGPAPRERYRALLASIGGPALRGFVGEHPVIGRLWAEELDRSVEAAAELLGRLRADAAEVSARLLGGAPATPLASLASLGDPHRGGRTVFRLAGPGGQRFLYKPRSLASDAALAALYAALTGRDGVERLEHVRIVDRARHGWVEFVEPRPLAERADAERFYRRVGALDALLYFLGSTDVHHENLIAAGDMPVLIDTETLLHAEIRPFLDADGAARPGLRSVLRSGLLPGWHEGPVGFGAIDTSGLGGVIPPGKRLRLEHINTDWMCRIEGNAEPEPEPNRPSLAGCVLSPNDFTASIVEGFVAAVDLLIAERARVAELLGTLAGVRSRIVLRNTQVYGAIKKRAHGSDVVRSGADRSLVYELVTRAYLVAARRPPAFSVVEHEIAELERLDVPIFEVEAGGAELILPDGTRLEGVLAGSGLDRAREGLAALSPADRDAQAELIEASLFAFGADPDAPEPPRPVPSSAPLDREERLDPDFRARGLRAAAGVGEFLRRCAIVGSQGDLSWIGTSLGRSVGRYQLKAISDELGDGVLGPALLFAALHRVGGRPADRDLAERTLAGLIDRVGAVGPARWAASTRLGGPVGLGSQIYALTLIGRLLERADWVALAGALVRGFDPARLTADTQLDLLGGSAGMALAFLAHHRATGDPAALTAAQACGARLVEARTESEGRRAWLTVSPRPLTGFSHGAAGIALALARVAAATGDDRARAAAREGLEFERSLYSPERQNWPDRRTDPAGWMVSWCHGAPGIGLGRLALAEVLPEDPALDAEIAAALATSRAEPLDGIDHLCCGNFGRLDFHLAVGRRRGDPSLVREVESDAGRLVARAGVAEGFYVLPGPPAGVLAPGLWQGVSGVGYELLRIGWPDELPSVLTFEI